MSFNSRPCNRCVYECYFLRRFSRFAEENVRMYEDRFGICDGIARSYPELSHLYGYTPGVVSDIVEDIQDFLDDTLPYPRYPAPEVEQPEPHAPECKTALSR